MIKSFFQRKSVDLDAFKFYFLITLFLTFLLGPSIYFYTRVCIDSYFPYEGIIVKKDALWWDLFLTLPTRGHGPLPISYFVIKKNDGKKSVKYVRISFSSLTTAFLKEGDYVIKDKGFKNTPHTITK